MKPLSEYPTPEADAIYEPKPSNTFEYIGEHKCRDLERRLAARGDALRRVLAWSDDPAVINDITETLTLTAPKP